MMIIMRGEDIKMMIKNCVNIYKIPIYKYVSKNGSVRCRCRHCRVNVKCLNRAKTNYLLYIMEILCEFMFQKAKVLKYYIYNSCYSL